MKKEYLVAIFPCFRLREYILRLFIYLIYSAGILLSTLACNSEDAYDCVKSTGEIISQEQPLLPFSHIILKDNINLHLTSQSSLTATVKAGKNLMPNIHLQSMSDTLVITNTNTCNWTRSFKHQIEVTLPINTSDLTITHRGYGNIKSLDTLKIPTLYLLSLDAGGDMDLQIQSNMFIVYSNSHARINLAGKAENLDIWMHKGIGRVSAETLQAAYCVVKHEGSNEIRVFPLEECKVEIYENGNVLYYNEPGKMTSTIKGSGRLIRK
jgi:hypothetical protein